MVGFWEPHTSSMDFCEENYRFTLYVAELLNAVTSLPIVVAGAWAWALMPNRYRGYYRFHLVWLGFISVGVGSTLFHSTLLRPAQALDEIPMVLGNVACVYCLASPQGIDLLLMGSILVVFSIFQVAVYVAFEAYVVFFLMYGLLVLYLTVASARLVFFMPAKGNGPLLRKLFKIAFGLYFSGFGVWVADHALCSQLGVGHLHMAWHFMACGGTLLYILLLVALTADADNIIGVELMWTGLGMPMMPYLRFPDDQKSTTAERGKED